MATDATVQAQANMPSSGEADASVDTGKKIGSKKDGLAAYEPTRVISPEDDKDVLKAAEAERKMRAENPNLVLVRDADPNLGGHSFDYGKRTD